jgi:hypothetical protein
MQLLGTTHCRHGLVAWLLLALATPATAAEPWFGQADPTSLEADDDAVADAPVAEPAEADRVDLSTVATALEDGVRRIIRDSVDPVQALPLEVAGAPKTTAAELRGLIEGSGARDAKLHALQVRWIFWSGETAVAQVAATLLPGHTTALLRLELLGETPDEVRALALPGGLGVSWNQAEKRLSRLLLDKRCGALPAVDDAALSRLVPAAYLPQAQALRNKVPEARDALCALLAPRTWDRLEMRPVELHFNLFDGEGALRGGINLRLDPDSRSPRLAFPMFKKLPE